MWGVVPCTNGVLGEAETDISKLRDHPLFKGMLVCHSLTLINGELCGDPLDVKVKNIRSISIRRDHSISRCNDIVTHYRCLKVLNGY